MGTNFYWKIKPNFEENEDYFDSFHIGKRSGAGKYCTKCETTLCKKGKNKIHSSSFDDWYDKCPICNSDKHLTTVCSFSWESKRQKKLVEGLAKINRFFFNKKVIIDEYNNEYTAKEFLENELKNVKFEHFVGEFVS